MSKIKDYFIGGNQHETKPWSEEVLKKVSIVDELPKNNPFKSAVDVYLAQMKVIEDSVRKHLNEKQIS